MCLLTAEVYFTAVTLSGTRLLYSTYDSCASGEIAGTDDSRDKVVDTGMGFTEQDK